MITIDSTELSNEQLKNIEENISVNFLYQTELTNKLDELDCDFDENIINKIVLWKVNRAPSINSETLKLINQIDKSATNIDESLTSEILKKLLSSPGFDLPMASTLLRFKNPNIYQIIDKRVYRFINPGKTLILTGSIDNKIKLYFKYLRELKTICKDISLDFTKIDRTFYKADKDFNKDYPLIRNSSKPKELTKNE